MVSVGVSVTIAVAVAVATRLACPSVSIVAVIAAVTAVATLPATTKVTIPCFLLSRLNCVDQEQLLSTVDLVSQAGNAHICPLTIECLCAPIICQPTRYNQKKGKQMKGLLIRSSHVHDAPKWSEQRQLHASVAATYYTSVVTSVNGQGRTTRFRDGINVFTLTTNDERNVLAQHRVSLECNGITVKDNTVVKGCILTTN